MNNTSRTSSREMEIANLERDISQLVARLAKLQPDPETEPKPFKCPAFWTKEDATDCIRKLNKKLAFQDACLASNDKKFARLRAELKDMRDERNNAKAMARNPRRTPPTVALGNALKEQRAENKALKQENKRLDKQNQTLKILLDKAKRDAKDK
jgi:uncharacterized coiled-coil protein SlyX